MVAAMREEILASMEWDFLQRLSEFDGSMEAGRLPDLASVFFVSASSKFEEVDGRAGSLDKESRSIDASSRLPMDGTRSVDV